MDDIRKKSNKFIEEIDEKKGKLFAMQRAKDTGMILAKLKAEIAKAKNKEEIEKVLSNYRGKAFHKMMLKNLSVFNEVLYGLLAMKLDLTNGHLIMFRCMLN